MTQEAVGRWMIRICLWITIPVVIAFYLLLGCGLIKRYWPPLPAIDDKRLVGAWQGGTSHTDILVEFKTDGQGSSSRSVVGDQGNRIDLGARPFEWGTRDGVFYARYLATDYWAKPEKPYTLSPTATL